MSLHHSLVTNPTQKKFRKNPALALLLSAIIAVTLVFGGNSGPVFAAEAVPAKPALTASQFTYDQSDVYTGTGQVAEILSQPAGVGQISLFYQAAGSSQISSAHPVAVGLYRVFLTTSGNTAFADATDYLLLGDYRIVPAQPQTITQITLSENAITVSWTPQKNAANTSGYQIAYYLKGQTQRYLSVSGAATAKKKLTGLSNSKDYYVKVRAFKTFSTGVNAAGVATSQINYSSWCKTRLSPYTGMSTTLDGYLRKIFHKYGHSHGALHKYYLYVAHLPYIGRHHKTLGEKGGWKTWSVKLAKQMYKDHGGNCYRYASLFCWIARSMGYNARTYAGTCGGNHAPHGWCQIAYTNGKKVVCDPCMENEVPSRDWYMETYAGAPMAYHKGKN